VLPGRVALAYAPTGGLEPGAPTLLSPIDGVTVTSTPLFSWDDGVNALTYGVKVWPAGNPATMSCGGGVPNLTLMCADLPPGNYEWTVQSFGLNGRQGGISAIGSFTRATPFTGAPVLVAPANGATLDYPDSLGVLRWQATPGAANYLLQTSTSPTFAEGEPDLIYANGELSWDIPREHIGVTQYWRVRGVNAAKTWGGPWSAVRSFTVTWTDVPTPLTPADGASASNVILSWTPVKGAVDYDVQGTALDDTDFSDASQATPWPIAHWIAWGPEPSGDFRWRVRARNDHGGVTAWSATFIVHRDAGAPAATEPDPVDLDPVQLVSPADGATLASYLDAPLRWTPVAGALGYEFDFRIGAGSWANVNARVGSSPIRWHFDPGVTYGWRVRAVGDLGELGPWSAERTLSISDPPPVVLVSPPDGGELPASSTLFAWQPLTGSGAYAVELSDNPAFDPPQSGYGFGLDATYETLRGALPAGTWYWRVRAGSVVSEGLSDVRSVVIVDDQAPAGQVWLDGGTPWTAQNTVAVDLPADDGTGDPTEVQLSADSLTWEAHTYPLGGELVWSLTDPAHGGPDPGQRHVHAKWRDAAGNWSTVVSASIWYGMPPPADATPPSGTITIAGGAAFTKTRLPLIAIPASDIGGVKTIALSTDGVVWDERPYWPTQQVALPSTNGTKTIHVKWKDYLGNWSTAAQDTIVLDNVAPTTTWPKPDFTTGVVASGAVPTRFTWSGADATSGIARYEAALSTDGGAYATISTSLTSAAVTRSLMAGHTYRMRVRAIDKAGNAGSWATGASFAVAAYQDGSSRITYSGTWTVGTSSAYWGPHERYAKAAGARATFTFTGRSFAWIGCVGPSRGRANVYVNGTFKQSVNLYAAASSCRNVLLGLSWSAATSRTIRIVVVGTVGHPRVDLDAVVTGS
jgi:hypothetical protein